MCDHGGEYIHRCIGTLSATFLIHCSAPTPIHEATAGRVRAVLILFYFFSGPVFIALTLWQPWLTGPSNASCLRMPSQSLGHCLLMFSCCSPPSPCQHPQFGRRSWFSQGGRAWKQSWQSTWPWVGASFSQRLSSSQSISLDTFPAVGFVSWSWVSTLRGKSSAGCIK